MKNKSKKLNKNKFLNRDKIKDIVAFILGLFILLTVAMAWLGGVSSFIRKSVTASAESTTEYIGTFYSAPFYGSFVGSGYMYSKDSIAISFNFTRQSFSLASYNFSTSTLGNTISITYNVPVGFTLTCISGASSYPISFMTSVQKPTFIEQGKRVVMLTSCYYRYTKSSSNSECIECSLKVLLDDGSSSNFLIQFIPTMPFDIPNDLIDNEPFGFNMLNIQPTDGDSSIPLTSYYQNGYNVGYGRGKSDGYDEGLQVGYNRALNEQANGHTFKDLMNAVFFAPMSFLYSLLNFDILGVNMYYFLTSILTLTIVLFVVRLVL